MRPTTYTIPHDQRLNYQVFHISPTFTVASIFPLMYLHVINMYAVIKRVLFRSIRTFLLGYLASTLYV